MRARSLPRLPTALLLAALVLAAPAPLPGQQADGDTGDELPSLVLLDPSFSIFSTTTSLQAAADGLYALEDRVLPFRLGDESGVGGTLAGIAYRLGRLVLLDFPVASLHTVVRHEIAGHGGRVRLAGGDVLGYEIDLPPPYGEGGGSTRFTLDDPGPLDLPVTAAGGLESALVGARGLEEKWVARGRMDVREGLQYLLDVLEVISYVTDARSLGVRRGHDVEIYLSSVNAAAPADAPGGPVTADRLGDEVTVEALNPTLYFALYAVLGRYLVSGDRYAPIPALELGGVRVMPTAHLRLAPFGREYAVGVTAAWEERVLHAGLRLGDGPWGGFHGLELEGRRLYTGPRLQVGARAGLWRQYDLGAASTELEAGGMAVLRVTTSVGGLPFSPVAELGAKSEGYVPGESLSSGPIARVGAAFRF